MTQRKSVLITGGAKRIGRAIAEIYAANGFDIIIHYNRSREEAEALVKELNSSYPGDHCCVKADLSSEAGTESLCGFLTEKSAKIQTLINNASTYIRRKMSTVTTNEWIEDYQINCLAPFKLMQAFYNHCKQGHIINLLDQRVVVTDADAGSYGLAKKTLRDITDACAVKWAPEIRVNAIAPGYILPPPGVAYEKMIPHLQKVPMKINSTPEEIAEAAIFMEKISSMTGQIIFMDGGLHLTGLN